MQRWKKVQFAAVATFGVECTLTGVNPKPDFPFFSGVDSLFRMQMRVCITKIYYFRGLDPFFYFLVKGLLLMMLVPNGE